MSEAAQEAGHVPGIPPGDTQPGDEQARNFTIFDYFFKVIGAMKEVDKAYSDVVAPVGTLGDKFDIEPYKQKIISVVLSVFLKRGEIRNIMSGCIQFELRCFTEDKFLEISKDYESGKIRKSLEEEFLKVGIKITGLVVKIINSEEVERTKTALEKRYEIY